MSDNTLDLENLTTEDHRPDLLSLDLMSTGELVSLMNAEDALVPAAVAAATDQIATAIDAIAARMSDGGRLIYIGAGTPGRLAVVDASECGPTFNARRDQIQAIIAGGDEAITNAREGDEDDYAGGATDLDARKVKAADSVVGISASGRTPYVLGAIERARAVGALTVGIACNPDAPLSSEVDHGIEVVTGPEVISGSTRLKAGTAEKLVLNMISTIVMVRLGKTFGNLMVEVRASNEKLRLRTHRIVRLATGASDAEASQALDAASGDAKVAILVLLTGRDAKAAATLLREHNGHLRHALEGAT